MIIDSSAIVAIVLEESDFSIYLDQIATATTKQMSAPSLLDKIISRESRKGI